MQQIQEEILEQTISGLAQEDCAFKGVLYAGLMITRQGPKVIEFNCRFGDPETQVVLPLLDGDLVEIFLSIIEGELKLANVQWREGAAACVILASGGYPGPYEKGLPITGLRAARDKTDDLFYFHSGTRWVKDHYVTDGGRVMGITAVGKDVAVAVSRAYQEVERIRFDGMHYRRDIGFKSLPRVQEAGRI
jgi:phosphoribosylamine--glycine ligase